MLLAAAVLVLAAYCCHTAGGRLLQTVRAVSLAALARCFACTADLGVNYANALPVAEHDGIVLTGVLSRLIYKDWGWTLSAFFESFNNMLTVTAVVAVENAALGCFALLKKR